MSLAPLGENKLILNAVVRVLSGLLSWVHILTGDTQSSN